MSDPWKDFQEGLVAAGSAAISTAPLWLPLLLSLGLTLGVPTVQSLRTAKIINW
jgi:hypothetical protein